MKRDGLIKIGGVFGLLVAATQLGGNAFHPPIPVVTEDALRVIAETGPWNVVHLVITVSYFLFIPFAIGLGEAFERPGPEVRIGVPLVIVGASLGGAQILTHLTIFRDLAESWAASGGGEFVLLYETLWPYAVALEIAHLLVIYAAAVLFGIAMLRETLFERWAGWLGIGAGVAATAGILVGKIVMNSSSGDIVFGVSIVPLLVWIVSVAIMLLKAERSTSGSDSTAPAGGA